eukprot:1010096-Prymnesium_polylepis.1
MQLRAASVRQRARDTWGTVSPSLYWLLRASFGLALLTSLTLVVTGEEGPAAAARHGRRQGRVEKGGRRGVRSGGRCDGGDRAGAREESRAGEALDAAR